jgi:methylated-DNA-protein-cysteine methyltransferase related protein
MSNSPFFKRIKTDILQILKAVPFGRLVTFRDVGEHLDVMPRHVAYILAQLEGDEQASIPWFRAVADNGILSKPKFNDFGLSQRDLLIEEKHFIAPDGRILELAQKIIVISEINSGVAKQTRPSNAPLR